MIGFDLVVFGEAVVMIEPGKGTLDDPALGQNAKSRAQFWHDLQSCALSAESFSRPTHQGPGITSIGKNHPQPAKPAGFVDDHFGPVAILDIGRLNHSHQNQSEGVDQEVALAPRHLLASIVATFSGLVSHLNRLRVKDGRRGGLF